MGIAIDGPMTEPTATGGVPPEIRALTEGASEIVGTLDLDEQMRRVAQRARLLAGADVAAVATVEDDGRTLWRAIDGERTHSWASTSFAPGRGTAGRVIARNAPVVITGFPDNPEFPADEFPVHLAEGTRTAVGLPLREEGAPFGAVIVGWRRDCAPAEPIVSLLQTLTDMAAAAITVSRRTAALERQRVQTERQAEAMAYLNAALQDRNRELDTRVAELDAVLDQMADGVIIVGTDGRIARANPAAERMHGRPLPRIGMEEWQEYFGLRRPDGQPFPGNQVPLARAALHGETIVSEEWIVERPDGTLARLLGSAAPLVGAGGERRGAVLVMRDVTERAELVDQLQRATTVKERFFAQMSHELRTPINAVLGYGTLLQEGFGGELSDKGQDMLVRILRSARHLLELVNDVLDISKLEAGKIQITPRDVDLAALARETLPTVQPQADAKRLVLELRAPERLPMRTDPARVRQILLNLLSNAVKFTGEGGRVVVSLDDRGQRGLALAVQDTGTGIAPEHQESIFAEFVQVGSRSDGTGLGLAISRRLARLLCGDLRVASEVGRGSTFTLTLPRDYDVSPAREDEEPAAVRPSRAVTAGAGAALSPHA